MLLLSSYVDPDGAVVATAGVKIVGRIPVRDKCGMHFQRYSRNNLWYKPVVTLPWRELSSMDSLEAIFEMLRQPAATIEDSFPVSGAAVYPHQGSGNTIGLPR